MAFCWPVAPQSRSPGGIASVGIPSGSLGTLAQPLPLAAGWVRIPSKSSAMPSDNAPPGLRHRPVAAAAGQRQPELAAGGDIELGEDLGQVVLDGARGQEQLGGDLRVRQA